MTETERAELDALPLTVFLQLEEACGRFEAAWQSAPPSASGPRIEDYLAPTGTHPDREGEAPAKPETTEVMDHLRSAMARELVRIDIAYRRRAGESPRPSSYLTRFPDLDSDWLAAALAEPTGTSRATPNPMKQDTPAMTADMTPKAFSPPLSLPARCGDYELLEEIARGGMGVVYKARQASLDRIVALKMILPSHRLTEEAVTRFHREARAAAALDHPNIVAIHASGEHNGRPYFTMAYVEGNNLRTVVQQQGLPARQQAADWLRAVAEAVGCAHQQGIIHRDLKPENVLIDRQGRPRVTDFGLAYRPDVGPSAERLTQLGEVLGTPAYMSPEQATNTQDTGPATDIYSLGGILYFLLTGQPPFQGRSMSEVLAQVLTGTPKPPRQLIPQASAELEAICLRCLEKDPARRYPSAAALAAALRAADQPETAVAHRGAASVTMKASEPSAALPAPAVPPSAPSHIADRNTRWKTIGVAATALAIVAVGVWLVMTRMPRSDATPEMLAPPEKLRTDFPLTVTMLDDQGNVLKPGPEGLIRLRTDAVVKFRIKVARAAYVGVWSVNSDGTICQLFPNDKEKDHYFKQGEERDVPRTEALAEETQGTAKFEWVWVQAATQPWEADQGKRRGDFLVFQTDEERSQWATSRGTPRGFRLRSEVALTEAVLKYRVAPR